MENKSINDFASKSLGSENSYAIYSEKYDPSLLVKMPRYLARQEIKVSNSPFGVDVWHGYECTFLLNNGLPISGILKFVYPSSSFFMVESKSMKLYLNTFDMCKLGEEEVEAVENYLHLVGSHLSECLEILPSSLILSFHSDSNFILPKLDLNSLINLESLVSKDDKFNYSELVEINNHIKTLEIKEVEERTKNWTFYKTNILRSRCRHTKQKDTGYGFFFIKTSIDVTIDPLSLLKQVLALRETNEFHEFCSEKLYTAIKETEGVEECCVVLMYVRRGGLDINPIRSSLPFKDIPHHLPEYLSLGKFLFERTFIQ